MSKYTKEEIIAALIERKRDYPLEFFEPLPAQKAFIDSKAKIKCAWGGNRSGKSHLGAYYTLTYALNNPNSNIWVAGTTFRDSINIQQKKIKDFLPKSEVKYARWTDENGFTNRVLVLKNGSKITFKSYDQGREQFQGEAVDLIWLDEEGPVDIYNECLLRLMDTNGEMILTMTSLKGMTSLLEKLYDGADVKQSRYAEYLDEHVPVIAEKNGVEFFFLWTTDNPHIHQDRLEEEIRKLDKNEIKSRIYGIPTNLAGRIYPNFNKDIHVITWEEVPNCAMNIYTVLDPHDRKPFAISWWAIHPTGTHYCVDEYPTKRFGEIEMDDKTYDEYCDLIKEKERKLCKLFKQPHVTGRFIDPNFGNKTVKLAERQGGFSTTTPKLELGKRGLSFRDAYDGLRDGHLSVREALDWKLKNGELVKQPKIQIVDYCINTIEHMSKYGYKDPSTKDGDVRDTVGLTEKYKDFCDLIRYICTAGVKYIDWKERRRELNKANNTGGRKY